MPGDYPITWVFPFASGPLPGLEQVELFEGARVKEQLQPFTRRELVFPVLHLDALGASTLQGSFLHVLQGSQIVVFLQFQGNGLLLLCQFRYSPNTSRSTPQISPRVAYSRDPGNFNPAVIEEFLPALGEFFQGPGKLVLFPVYLLLDFFICSGSSGSFP
jgi:hypothetical protein